MDAEDSIPPKIRILASLRSEPLQSIAAPLLTKKPEEPFFCALCALSRLKIAVPEQKICAIGVICGRVAPKLISEGG